MVGNDKDLTTWEWEKLVRALNFYIDRTVRSDANYGVVGNELPKLLNLLKKISENL